MISSQSKDVVNIYIKFRLLLLIKYVLQKCIELVKKIWYRFLARKVAPQNFKHIAQDCHVHMTYCMQ